MTKSKLSKPLKKSKVPLPQQAYTSIVTPEKRAGKALRVLVFCCIALVFGFVMTKIFLHKTTIGSLNGAITMEVTQMIYAAPQGSDDKCNREQPCNFFVGLSHILLQGGVLVLKNGVYNRMSTNYSASYKENTSGRPVTIRSETPGGAKLLYNTPDSGYYALYFIGNDITVEGLDISGANLAGGLSFSDGNTIMVKNNRLHDIATATCQESYAVNLLQTGKGKSTITSTVSGNTIFNIGPDDRSCNKSSGISVSIPRSVVMNNLISSVDGTCISFMQDATQMAVMNNTLDHCISGIRLGAAGPYGGLQKVLRGVVANNIVRDAAVCMDEKDKKVGKIDYLMNDCWNNIENNLVTISKRLNEDKLDNGLSAITLYEDPGFVNYPQVMSPLATGANYQLSSLSPLIDAGSASVFARNDIMNTPRPVGKTSDIGAYEYRP